MKFLDSFKAAHAVSTPLVAVRTFDNNSTIARVKTLWTKDAMPHLIIWDCVKGLHTYHEPTLAELNGAVTKAGTAIEATANLGEALRVASFLKGDCITFLANAHLFWADAPIIQGIWNLRDPYKAKGNMLVLLTSSGAILPNELANDFLVLDEPLPTSEEITGIIKTSFKDAKLPEPSPDVLADGTRALIGLPAFPADQSAAMCLDIPNGKMDIQGLWERKEQAINQTRGLAVLKTNASLDDIGGLGEIKLFLDRVMNGKDAPNVLLFLDEIEKGAAGAGTELSGVKTGLIGGFLTWSQDIGMRGTIALGLPGVGKSEIFKAIGNMYKKPVISLSIPDLESGIIGSSNENWRKAQAVLDAISDRKIFALATCNSIESLSPELRRRFAEAIFFFDAPDAKEKPSIWKIYRDKYEIPASDPTPNDAGWTGAEIKTCAVTAYRLGLTLAQAAQYVIPVTVSASERIDNLRRSSSGKYLSASYPGAYTFTGQAVQGSNVEEESTGRKMR